jgi:hypothetical protein
MFSRTKNQLRKITAAKELNRTGFRAKRNGGKTNERYRKHGTNRKRKRGSKENERAEKLM